MYIRAQFTGKAFKDLLRFRTSSVTRPCPQLYFEDKRLLLTRIEFLEIDKIFAGPQRPVYYPNNGPQEQVFQKSRLGLKLKFRITATTLNATNDLEAMMPMEGFVDVAFDLVVQNGKDFVTLEVLETDFDTLLSLAGVGKQEMSNLLSAEQMELGLLKQVNDLMKGVGGFLTLRHIDLGFDPGSDRVELRAELISSTPPSPTIAGEWEQFYSNSLDSLIGVGDWALHVDQRIGSDLLSRIMTAAIDSSGEFRRDGNVNVYWDAGLPGFNTSVEGELIDACVCLWGEIDLDVRAWAEVKFSLQNNHIRVDIRIDHKITDMAEAACCMITTTALFPIIGLGLAANKDIDWYEYFIGLALYPAPILLLIAIIAKLSSKAAEGLPIEICQTDSHDDKHFFCVFELPTLSESASCQGAKVSVRTETIMGRGDGLVLGGRIEMPQIVDPGIALETDPFVYQPPYYLCSGGLGKPDRFEASLRVFRTSGNYDFRVCRVHILGPFKHAAKVEIEHMTCPYTAWITITIGVTQYDYKPLKVLVSTTHGVLHAVIAPSAQQVSEEERREADLGARLERVNLCYAKQKQWDIKWHIDPAKYINPAQQHINVMKKTRQIWTLAGIAAAETRRVDIINEAGTLLAVMDTSTGRAFRLSLVEAGSMLSVVQDVTGDFERVESADLHAVQTLAGVERELNFETPVVAVDVVRMSPVRMVVIHERERLTLFEVTERAELIQLRTLETGGAEWVGRREGILYAMLRDGHLLRFDMKGLVGWRVVQSEKEQSYGGGCGCSNAAKGYATIKQSFTGFPMDERQFNHLVYKGNMRADHCASSARIRNGFWIREADGVLVTSAIDRKMRNSAAIRLESADQTSVLRLRNGTMLALGEQRNKLELLRALSRQEL